MKSCPTLFGSMIGIGIPFLSRFLIRKLQDLIKLFWIQGC